MIVNALSPSEDDRVLTTIVPHTTSVRASRFEIAIETKFLKPGAFVVQSISSIPTIKLQRRLGTLSTDQLKSIELALKEWLGLE